MIRKPLVVLLCVSLSIGMSWATNASWCEQFQDNATKYEDCVSKTEYQDCFDKCVGDSDVGVSQETCSCKCNGGIVLNTNVPFIGRCIVLNKSDAPNERWKTVVTQTTAFPALMKALMNILLSVLLVSSLIMIIAWGIMIASSGANSGSYEQGKKLIRKVIIGLILLWASGIILALINPNFFG